MGENNFGTPVTPTEPATPAAPAEPVAPVAQPAEPTEQAAPVAPTPAPAAPAEKGGKSKWAIIALVCCIISVCLSIYDIVTLLSIDDYVTYAFAELEPSALDTIISIVGFVSIVGSIAFGILTIIDCKKHNKTGKGLGILAIVLPLVAGFIYFAIDFGLSFKVGYNCVQAKDCVKNDENIATCKLEKEDIKCPVVLIQDSQYFEE